MTVGLDVAAINARGGVEVIECGVVCPHLSFIEKVKTFYSIGGTVGYIGIVRPVDLIVVVATAAQDCEQTECG